MSIKQEINYFLELVNYSNIDPRKKRKILLIFADILTDYLMLRKKSHEGYEIKAIENIKKLGSNLPKSLEIRKSNDSGSLGSFGSENFNKNNGSIGSLDLPNISSFSGSKINIPGTFDIKSRLDSVNNKGEYTVILQILDNNIVKNLKTINNGDQIYKFIWDYIYNKPIQKLPFILQKIDTIIEANIKLNAQNVIANKIKSYFNLEL